MVVRDAGGDSESTLLHETAPQWVTDIVVEKTIPKFVKIPFYLLPHPQMVKQERMKKVRSFSSLCSWQFIYFACIFEQDRLVANEFLQCRKVCEHVLDKIFGSESGVNTMISSNSQSNQNDNNSEGSQVPPEDKIELFCNNVVSVSIGYRAVKFVSIDFVNNAYFNFQSVDPNMDLRTVRHFIWKQSADLTFHYKSKPNFNYT